MKKIQRSETPVYYILPLLLLVAVVPLIVHLKVIPLDEVSYKSWTGQESNSDFFSYYKSILTIIFSILALAAFAIARHYKMIELKSLKLYYIPIAVYTVMVLLSSLYTDYPTVVMMGFVDRYEGMYVLISYMIILFTTINLVDKEKFIKVIVAGIFISAVVIGTIGIFQFFGVDFFKSELGKFLMLPESYRNTDLTFTFGPHTIYSTLYNTNYVGSYTAMLLPLAFAAFLYAKKAVPKIAAGVFTCLMFANWLGCRSRAGYMGGVIALAVLAILMRKSIIKNIKAIVPLLICIILIFVGMNAETNGELGGRIITTLSNIGDYSTVGEEETDTSEKTILEDIVLTEKMVSIVYGNNTLNLKLNNNEMQFSDADDKTLIIKNDPSGNITFEDERYSPYNILIDMSTNTLDIKIDKMGFILYIDPTGFKFVGERNALVDEIDRPESFGFEGKEKFASMRGYIWSRSIPMLKDNLIIGGGPDTFAIQFPQRDYVGKLRAFDRVTQIVDKPHNMYLQAGINTGVVSLIAFVFILALYILSSLKVYLRKTPLDDTGILGVAILTAVIGYAIAGLANDSLVSVAPVFWVILGLGISCNYMVNRKTATDKNKQVAGRKERK